LETGLFRAFEVNFSSGRSTLLPRAKRSLDAVGEVLQQYPSLRLEIAGYTDAVGNEDANQELSQERASAVRDYLVDQFALAPDRFEVQGYGEARPIASNDTPAGRELNRRVEFVVLNPEEAERILDISEPSSPED
jgi:outer membrane protein OmpA-like peptidoglycan-associated protein